MAWCKDNGAWCTGQDAWWCMGHVAKGMVHVQGGTMQWQESMVHKACWTGAWCMRAWCTGHSHPSSLSQIRDALPHLPSPSMPLKSETQLPLITTSEIRDTRPLHFTTSEIRGIRCLCFQRHVSDFIDASLISETSWLLKFRKVLITFLTQEIWN